LDILQYFSLSINEEEWGSEGGAVPGWYFHQFKSGNFNDRLVAL